MLTRTHRLKPRTALKCIAGCIVTALLIVALAWAPGSAADSPSAREYLVKAAFLYNFAKFVEWPPAAFVSDTSPLTLCILGDDPFGKAIDTIEGKAVGRRRLAVHRTHTLARIDNCHILFVARSERARVDTILIKAGQKGVLTVSDLEGFADSGGMIGLIREGDKVRFEINLEAARQAGLVLSSKLLNLAKIVEPKD
jgi:hypothetical protein